MVGAHGVALAKPVTGHPLFDEWRINCALDLGLVVIPIKLLEILFCGLGHGT
jgi:hypothetical protein